MPDSAEEPVTQKASLEASRVLEVLSWPRACLDPREGGDPGKPVAFN